MAYCGHTFLVVIGVCQRFSGLELASKLPEEVNGAPVFNSNRYSRHISQLDPTLCPEVQMRRSGF